MIATLYLLLASIFGVVPTPALECHISNIAAERSLCNDSGYYNIILNFQHENTSDSFEIEGYGTYAYSNLPLTLSHFKGDGTNHTFHIYDLHNHDCGGTKIVEGRRCAPFNCGLGEISLQKTDCDSLNHFYVTLFFNHENTSDSFSLQGNGLQYGHFAYADLPIVLGPFDGAHNGSYEFVAKDLLNPDCRTSTGLNPPFCNECSIYDVTAERWACDSSGHYNISFNFQYQSTSDSFEISGYGHFAYADLPVTLHGFIGNGASHSFDFIDLGHHDCTATRNVEGRFCDLFNCDLGEMHLDKSDCDSQNQFYVTISFAHENTSDSFSIQGNGHQYGHFAYTDLPIVLGPFDGNHNGSYEFIARELLNPDCRTAEDINPPFCTGCSIYEIHAERSLCDSAGYYDITFNFQHQSTSDSFAISSFGHFAYADLPVTLHGFVGNGESHSFDFTDLANHDCTASRNVEGRLCNPFNCDLGEMSLTKSDCDSLNQFYVTISFAYENSSDSFSLQGNDHQYGHFAYADLPIVLGPFDGSHNGGYEFVAKDLLNPDCRTVRVINHPYCNECSIYDIRAERSLCDNEGYYNISINFHSQSTSDSFTIAGYGEFAYSDLPVTLYHFKGDGSPHTFEIIDLLNHNCFGIKHVEGRTCDSTGCQLSGLTLSRSDCNENHQFFVTLDFDYSNSSDSFRIQGNGHMYGHFAYTDLPVILGPFDGNSGQSYEFGITDLENPNCHIAGFIEPPYCDGCYIREISAEKSQCDSTGHYAITFNFEHNSTSDSFNISGYGHFAYADLPVTLSGFAGDGQAHVFHFTDLENPNCTKVREVAGKRCESEDCLLSNLSVTLSNCNEDHFFYLEVNFDFSQVSDSFFIRGNGLQYGRFSYDDLPVSIGPLNGNTDRNYEFAIEDLIFVHCAIDTVIEPPYCQSDSIGGLIKYISLDNLDCVNKNSYTGMIGLSNSLPQGMKVSVWEGNQKLGEALVSDFPKQFNFSMNELPAIKIQDVNNPANVYFLHYDHPDCSKLSVKTTNIEYKVYPNPVTEKLYVEGPTELSVILKSINGRILSRDLGERIELNMRDYKPGIYILEIQSKQGIAIQKVIKM